MLVGVILNLLVLGMSALPPDPPLAEEYDFIVVGAGAAGSVVASRLSETSATVLVLEAGGDEGLTLMAPVSVSLTIATSWNWGYRAELNPNACQGNSDKRCPAPRGKLMGGTTSINLLIYTRGNRRDYDRWEEAGNPGWAYKDVLPYFLKSENQTDPRYIGSAYHSVGGPLTVSTPNYHTPISQAYLEAAQSLGYPITDINGEQQYGLTFSQAMVRDGVRLSSNRAFLNPEVRRRPNLTISLRSFVTRLLIQDGAVIGVEFEKKDKLHNVLARKEVILSAGTFNSPKILMLSGIGPEDHLQQVGIPVMKNLSVGNNLQDHTGASHLLFELDKSIESIGEDLLNDLKVIEQWLAGGGGPYGVQGCVEALGFVNSSMNEYGKDWPDIEIFMQGTTTETAGTAGWYAAIDNPPTNYFALTLHERGNPAISMVPTALRPKSRGMVRLRSTDPKDPPLIIANFLTHPDDVKIVLEGIRLILKIIETPVFKKMGARFNSTYAPDCESYQFNSDAFWECWMKTYTALFHHASGTCKMGPPSDPEAVVDSRLRVYGVQKVRVIDASILPWITSAHTAAPTIMIAEKGSDMIKEDWGYRNKHKV